LNYSNKFKIQKDNLTPKEKKKAYLYIFLLITFFAVFFVYKNYSNNKQEELLSKNTELTYCKIIGINPYKNVVNYLEYFVKGKRYETRPLGRKSVEIGEFYEIKFSKSNPEISEINFTVPIILNEEQYSTHIAKIIEKHENKNWKILTFEYNIGGKHFERDVYLKKIENFKKGKKVEILVNEKNLKISYLKEQIKNE
jgi:hypothetical protein